MTSLITAHWLLTRLRGAPLRLALENNFEIHL